MFAAMSRFVSALKPAPRLDNGLPWKSRDWARATFAVLLVNLALAAGLYISADVPGEFWEILLYTQCIGLSIFALHTALAFLPLPGSRVVRMVERAVLAVPVGSTIGSHLAAWLVGDPTPGILFVGVPPIQVMITILTTVCVVYFFWSRGRLNEEMAAHARAEQFASEAKLRLLRAQLDPHMLFNTLANLRILVEVDAARAQTMIDQLIVFMRSSLSASRSEMRSLESEFEQLRAYLDLMKIRMAERLQFELELPAALKDVELPAMLIQPLLENAIKHGLEPSLSGGRLTVRASSHGDQIDIEVLDTGLGLDQVHPEGYGLTHITERLEALYGDQAQFLIEPAPGGGTRCLVRVPTMSTKANP
jgi:signal transduction histidine kinase